MYLKCNNKGDGIATTEQEIQRARENDAVALYNIGEQYHKNRNFAKSFPWFYRAALLGHTDAQAEVGWMYERGKGVSRDNKHAVIWYNKAAPSGNMKAQYSLAYLYFWGHRAREDKKQALHWFKKAANNGNIDAMNWVGWMYRWGYGTTKNIPAAIEWYTKATNKGHTEAQFNLGFVYHYEIGVEDLQKAVNWYQKALDQNFERAKDKVKELNRKGYYAKEEQQGILITCCIYDDNY
jgi:TPR repeat protein